MADEAWERIVEERRLEAALRAAPDGPVTRLQPADYIPVRVRASQGVIIAYTPTCGLYDSTFHGMRQIRWEQSWQIVRIET